MIKRFYRFLKRLKRITFLFYLGNKLKCPVCGSSFTRFKTYKGNYFIRGEQVDHTTANYSCPKCGSGIRHRLLMGFLTENKNLLIGKKDILHFAPELSIIKYFEKNKNINYLKADINPQKIKGAIKLDITSIDIGNNAIDAVICIHVLEHIKNDLKAISELYRILKNDGLLFLALPIYGEKTFELKNSIATERKLQYGIADHRRLNGLDIKLKLEKFGFNVKTISIEDLKGNYFDLKIKTPHSESDKYLFLCTKNVNF